MKTLFLIRHAKPSWDDPAQSDKDRPLNGRGKRDAVKMGERLAKRNVEPALVLSSPAVRALATAEIFAKKLDYKRRKIAVDERLYAAETKSLSVNKGVHCSSVRDSARDGGRRWRKHGWNHG